VGRGVFPVKTSEKRRSIIVTGASRGLGRAIALCFGRKGDGVVVNYLSHEAGAAEVVKEIHSLGGEAFSCQANIRISADVDKMINDTVQRLGSVDILVNNTGITRDGLILRMSEDDWDDVIATNLSGPFHCVRAASQVMVGQKHGHIMNIASITGVKGREGQANYSASKSGLISFTKACALELGRFNIKVNALLPGYIPTDMGSKIGDAVLDRILGENALGRVSDPNEVADFIYHLSLMNNVSGQVFNLDSRML
jgi:3-oxoacyl-[acyl-carrier protein] reductase